MFQIPVLGSEISCDIYAAFKYYNTDQKNVCHLSSTQVAHHNIRFCVCLVVSYLSQILPYC